MLPQKILKPRHSEMPFPAFSEGDFHLKRQRKRVMRLMDKEPCERFANERKIMGSGWPKIINTLLYKILVKKRNTT